ANRAKRSANREALKARMDLPGEGERMLFGVVSRLSWQKGCDLLLAALPRLLALGGDIVVLGSGDADLEAGFRAAMTASPGRVRVRIGYDESLAHLIQG